MPPVRILIDGYSLLHKWLAIAPGRARYSESARSELVRWLTKYHDATGTPISIFFDGTGSVTDAAPGSTPEVEVLFSKKAKTADQLIERATHRLVEYGEVLVVTDDRAEQQTVVALGGTAIGCKNFIRMVEEAVAQMQNAIKNRNKNELAKFNRPKHTR